MLSFGHSSWLLLPIGIVGIGLAFAAYHRVSPKPPLPVRSGLVTLRALSFSCAAGLLLSPACERTATVHSDPVLALLIDGSESMNLISRDSTNAAQSTRKAVSNAESLPGTHRTFIFNQTTTEVLGPDSLTFDGIATNISNGLRDVRAALRNDNLRAVLLISDGLHNSGNNPIYLAPELGVPVHTMAVGDSTARHDLLISSVLTNEVGYSGREQVVRVSLQYFGMGAQDITVRLLHADSVIASTSTRVHGGLGVSSAEMMLHPAEPGMQQYTVAVTHLEGEVTHRNNVATTSVRVLGTRKRILILAAAPSPDVGSLRRFLDLQGPENYDMYVQKGRDEFYGGPLAISPSHYELVILAGFPGPNASRSALQAVAELADAGTPLLFMASRVTDLASLKIVLGEYLPALPNGARAEARDVMVAPTPAGLQHPALDFDNVNHVALLPPLEGLWADWKPTPDATILAASDPTPDAPAIPLLVTRRRSGSRTAAFLAGRFWRWENLPDDLDAASHIWPVLFEGLVQWLTVPEDQRTVRVNPATPSFGGGTPAQMVGQTYDESLNPLENAAIAVTVTNPIGNTNEFQMQSLGNGQFGLDLGTLPTGRYGYNAVATHNDGRLGEDSGTFLVGGHQLEYRETRTNTTMLRQIAARSGGLFLTPDRMEMLDDHLANDPSFAASSRTETTVTNLWRWIPTFLVILLLLTAEWVIRKRVGLA